MFNIQSTFKAQPRGGFVDTRRHRWNQLYSYQQLCLHKIANNDWNAGQSGKAQFSQIRYRNFNSEFPFWFVEKPLSLHFRIVCLLSYYKARRSGFINTTSTTLCSSDETTRILRRKKGKPRGKNTKRRRRGSGSLPVSQLSYFLLNFLSVF